jgi:multiple sugar transport system substrate-binding protein
MKKIFIKYVYIILISTVFVLSFYLNKDNPDSYITFATWGTLEELESYTKLVIEYNKKNPPFPVKLVHVTGEYDQKITVMAAAKNAPDVFKTYNGMLRFFYKNNIIENLTPYVKSDSEINLKNFFPELVKLSRIDSLQIAIPIVFSTLVLYYNKTHFDMEKLPYPDSCWTWDNYLYAAKKLTKFDRDNKIVRYGCYSEVIRPILIKQWGGHHFNPDRDTSMIATSEGAEALQFYVDLYNKHHVTLDPVTRGFRTEEIFSSERASMLINGRWATPWFVKTMRKGSFDVAPVPRKKEHLTGLAAHFLVMSSTSKKKQAAWDFIKYLVGNEAQSLTSEYGNNIPALKAVAQSDVFLKNKNTPDINNRVFLDELPYAVEWPFEESPYVNIMYMMGKFDIARDKASAGNLSALEALKEYDSELNRVIFNEKHKNIPKLFWNSYLFYLIIGIIIVLFCYILLKRHGKNRIIKFS